MLSLTIAITLGSALPAAAAIFLLQRRKGDDAVRHIARLAEEIVAVAATIEADLAAGSDPGAFVAFLQRCRENGQRAAEALERGRALRQQEPETLDATLLLLHEDHRRMVDLRSEVDRALARKAVPAGGADRCVEIRLSPSKPSRWATSSLLTRPSTLT
jgi:hypothetical protein